MVTPSKKVFVVGMLTLTTLLLGGCFNFSGTNSNKTVVTDEKNRSIENAEFSVKLPREWDVIEPKDFTTIVPKETVMVFRNNVKNEDFTANVNLVRNPLQQTKETLEYAKEVINREKTSLYNFKEIKRDLAQIQIGDKKVDSYLITFEGKKTPEANTARFIQIMAVKGTNAYIMTGAYSLQETGANITAVEDILKSFALK